MAEAIRMGFQVGTSDVSLSVAKPTLSGLPNAGSHGFKGYNARKIKIGLPK